MKLVIQLYYIQKFFFVWFGDDVYMKPCTLLIHNHIKKITLKLKGGSETVVTIMLTGGSSAESLYKLWSSDLTFNHSNIIYYFGDERCVLPNHPDSNYGMAVSTLFPNGIPQNCKVERMRGEENNFHIEAMRYSNLLPESVDILLFSVGPDGHIASLFPYGDKLNEMNRAVVPVTGSKLPSERLTITQKIIKSAKHIIVIANGETKGKALTRALEDPNNIQEMPVRLTIGTSWFLDESAMNTFNLLNKNDLHNTRIFSA
jgi:6-phosphogluconolactonase